MISDDQAEAARITAPVVTRHVLLAAALPLSESNREREGRRRTRTAAMASARELKSENPKACPPGGCDPADGIEFIERLTQAVILIYSSLKQAGIIGSDGARVL
jgi:hypothetical protein|tara:strand:- start:186 stop:497 length:312 start_codon:yes stop_codon:yes gene_type:complete